jgi:hypothetical protein
VIQSPPPSLAERIGHRLIAFVVLALAALLACSMARGQDDPSRDATALGLLKAFVAEADLEATDDHAAIAHAMQRRAERRGVSLLEQVHAYVSALKPSHAPTDRTAWVLALESSCVRPEGFPSNLRWDDCQGRRCTPRRVRCLEALERAHAFLDGELRDPCGGATDWGSPRLSSDMARAARAVAAGRWVPARCARNTVNNFYVQRAP